MDEKLQKNSVDFVWANKKAENCLLSFTTHVFRFMAGEGGQTKQVTLDVLNTDRGLPLGILLAEDRYTFSEFFVSPSSVLLFWEGSSLLWRDILILN
jgi:hypothetical protein